MQPVIADKTSGVSTVGPPRPGITTTFAATVVPSIVPTVLDQAQVLLKQPPPSLFLEGDIYDIDDDAPAGGTYQPSDIGEIVPISTSRFLPL